MKLLMKIVFLAFVQFVLLTLAGCTIEAEYQVSGTCSTADVVYTDGKGEVVEKRSVSLPWNVSVEGEVGDFLYLSATVPVSGGTVYTTIVKEDDTFRESYAEGAFSISECYGEY